MWSYYRRWIHKAFEGPLGVFDIFTALVAVAGGAITHFWPTAQHLVGELSWQLPAIVLLVLVLFGIFRAPYAMHLEDQDSAAAAIAERDQTIQAMTQLRLLHQPFVTFGEAASDSELSVHWHLLKRGELLHRLLKALWRGDFGDGADGNGDGALTFDGERYGRFRAALQLAVPWGGAHGLPHWSAMEDEDDPMTWAKIRDRVHFDDLAAIAPSQYPGTILSYFDRVRMTREAFRAWYERLVKGDYER